MKILLSRMLLALGFSLIILWNSGCSSSIAFPDASQVKMMIGQSPGHEETARIWDRGVIHQLTGFLSRTREKWKPAWGPLPETTYHITVHGSAQKVKIYCGRDWLGTNVNGQNFMLRLGEEAVTRMVRMFDTEYDRAQLAGTLSAPVKSF